MVKLKELYSLPSKVVSVAEGVLSAHWFPEVPEMEWKLQSETEAALAQEGRIEVKELVYENIDHSRFVGMYTVWFDGKPVMITQTAGRSGDDHRRRWVTDREACVNLCDYLRRQLKVDVEEKDLFDPEAEVYEEALFCFYSHDFTEKFGYKCEPLVPGYEPYDEPHQFFTCLTDRNLAMVTGRAGLEMPEYVRRGEHVMQKVREVSEAEHANNPKVKEVCEEDGYPQIYIYRHCERPQDATVVSI